jgi:hypothetical protein
VRSARAAGPTQLLRGTFPVRSLRVRECWLWIKATWTLSRPPSPLHAVALRIVRPKACNTQWRRLAISSTLTPKRNKSTAQPARRPLRVPGSLGSRFPEPAPEFPLLGHGWPPSHNCAICQQGPRPIALTGFLRLLALHGDRHAPISAYSKGMRQNVLLDEPFFRGSM